MKEKRCKVLGEIPNPDTRVRTRLEGRREGKAVQTVRPESLLFNVYGGDPIGTRGSPAYR